MAIKVRIRDFQSIADATITIDGFTVITGTNNSGKSAVMRAIRGVFTNPPASALLRHGSAFLSVELTFADGTTIRWEKGWEKPDQRGGSVNRYFVDGKEIENVGRGCPPEVLEYGVREIKAASDRVWPQIADQFNGTLFLVDRPGSSIAEALSDVEKVGKLTSALQLSEKDRRSSESELKVRRSDVKDATKKLERFEGLEKLEAAAQNLSDLKDELTSKFSRIEDLERLQSRLQKARDVANQYAGLNPGDPPESTRSEKLRAGNEVVKSLLKRLLSTREEASRLSEFSVSPPPKADSLNSLRSQIEETIKMSRSLTRAKDGVQSVNLEFEEAQREHKSMHDEVQEILGDRGFCPVCDTVVEKVA